MLLFKFLGQKNCLKTATRDSLQSNNDKNTLRHTNLLEGNNTCCISQAHSYLCTDSSMVQNISSKGMLGVCSGAMFSGNCVCWLLGFLVIARLYTSQKYNWRRTIKTSSFANIDSLGNGRNWFWAQRTPCQTDWRNLEKQRGAASAQWPCTPPH